MVRANKLWETLSTKHLIHLTNEQGNAFIPNRLKFEPVLADLG